MNVNLLVIGQGSEEPPLKINLVRVSYLYGITSKQ
jgi:hypothetical protein